MAVILVLFRTHSFTIIGLLVLSIMATNLIILDNDSDPCSVVVDDNVQAPLEIKKIQIYVLIKKRIVGHKNVQVVQNLLVIYIKQRRTFSSI